MRTGENFRQQGNRRTIYIYGTPLLLRTTTSYEKKKDTRMDQPEGVEDMLQDATTFSTCSKPNFLKVEQDRETEAERIFMDELNRMIIQYNSARTLPAGKRLISALTDDDTSAKPTRRSQSSMSSEADELFPRENNDIHILNVSDDASEEPMIDIVGECEYQSAGEDFQKKRNPFDSSVKDTTSGMDFISPRLAKINSVDELLPGNAHQTNHDDNGGSSVVAAERARSTTPAACEALGNTEDVKGMRCGPIREYDNERSELCAKFCSDNRSADVRDAQPEARKRRR